LNNVTETKKEKVSNGKIKFSDNSKIVRSSFLIGVISLSSAILWGIITTATQKPNLIYIHYIILSIFMTTGFIGGLCGGINFRKGKNIFNILGFIFNLVTIIYTIWAIAFIVASDL